MAEAALVHLSQYYVEVDHPVHVMFKLKETIKGSCQSVLIRLDCLVCGLMSCIFNKVFNILLLNVSLTYNNSSHLIKSNQKQKNNRFLFDFFLNVSF